MKIVEQMKIIFLRGHVHHFMKAETSLKFIVVLNSITGFVKFTQSYCGAAALGRCANVTAVLIMLSVGMSRLFINLILKASHYLHMKFLNERISKWTHLSFYHQFFSRHLYLKFEKDGILFGRFFPYEVPESGDKISNSTFSKLQY